MEGPRCQCLDAETCCAWREDAATLLRARATAAVRAQSSCPCHKLWRRRSGARASLIPPGRIAPLLSSSR